MPVSDGGAAVAATNKAYDDVGLPAARAVASMIVTASNVWVSLYERQDHL